MMSVRATDASPSLPVFSARDLEETTVGREVCMLAIADGIIAAVLAHTTQMSTMMTVAEAASMEKFTMAAVVAATQPHPTMMILMKDLPTHDMAVADARPQFTRSMQTSHHTHHRAMALHLDGTTSMVAHHPHHPQCLTSMACKWHWFPRDRHRHQHQAQEVQAQ
jgi:hypothetical protein